MRYCLRRISHRCSRHAGGAPAAGTHNALLSVGERRYPGNHCPPGFPRSRIPKDPLPLILEKISERRPSQGAHPANIPLSRKIRESQLPFQGPWAGCRKTPRRPHPALASPHQKPRLRLLLSSSNGGRSTPPFSRLPSAAALSTFESSANPGRPQQTNSLDSLRVTSHQGAQPNSTPLNRPKAN